MALTKNQLSWAEIHIKNEDDRKKVKEGENPFELLKNTLNTIQQKTNSLGSEQDITLASVVIYGLSKRVEDITKYLEETTVPI